MEAIVPIAWIVTREEPADQSTGVTISAQWYQSTGLLVLPLPLDRPALSKAAREGKPRARATSREKVWAHGKCDKHGRKAIEERSCAGPLLAKTGRDAASTSDCAEEGRPAINGVRLLRRAIASDGAAISGRTCTKNHRQAAARSLAVWLSALNVL